MCPLAAHNRLLFFAAAVYSSNEANKAGGTQLHTIKQSIFLDVYGLTIKNNVVLE